MNSAIRCNQWRLIIGDRVCNDNSVARLSSPLHSQGGAHDGRHWKLADRQADLLVEVGKDVGCGVFDGALLKQHFELEHYHRGYQQIGAFDLLRGSLRQLSNFAGMQKNGNVGIKGRRSQLGIPFFIPRDTHLLIQLTLAAIKIFNSPVDRISLDEARHLA